MTSMSVSLSLPSMHHKKYYYSMLPCLRVQCAMSAQCHAPYNMGDYLRWAFIDKDRAFTLGIYSRRAFNQVNTVPG